MKENDNKVSSSEGTFRYKTLSIHGKEYVTVSERVRAFRTFKKYEGWGIEIEWIKIMDGNDVCCIAKVKDEQGRVRSMGTAQETKTTTSINSTSYVENCETSAVGRALAFLGLGIDESLSSASEVSNAIKGQENNLLTLLFEMNKELKKLKDERSTLTQEEITARYNKILQMRANAPSIVMDKEKGVFVINGNK